MLYFPHLILIKPNLTQCLWQPTINPISAAAAAATSAALAERASSVVAITGMVCDLVLSWILLVAYFLFNVHLVSEQATWLMSVTILS